MKHIQWMQVMYMDLDRAWEMELVPLHQAIAGRLPFPIELGSIRNHSHETFLSPHHRELLHQPHFRILETLLSSFQMWLTRTSFPQKVCVQFLDREVLLVLACLRNSPSAFGHHIPESFTFQLVKSLKKCIRTNISASTQKVYWCIQRNEPVINPTICYKLDCWFFELRHMKNASLYMHILTLTDRERER